MIKDSGDRTKFETGAVRDLQDGKGRCDLLPLTVVAWLISGGGVLLEIDKYIRNGDIEYLYAAIHEYRLNLIDKIQHKISLIDMVLDVSIQFKEGLEKYGLRNWEKGIPLSSYMDSAIRHYLKYLNGEEDENHDRAFVWNIMCAIWTHENKPEMIDLPFIKNKPSGMDLAYDPFAE